MTRIPMLAASAVLAAACGGSAGPGPTDPPPVPAVATVMVSPAALSLDTAGTAQLVAAARDENGQAVNDAAITWQSDASSIATVDADGTVTGVSAGVTTVRALSNGHSGSATITVEDIYDLDALGPPQLIEHDYLDLASIARISRFRSGFGHHYADDTESCRSMKHYFQPRGDADWSAIEIVSPVRGTVVELLAEQAAGTQVRIRPATVPAATVYIFHVDVDPGLAVGDEVAAGERLGTHIGNVTLSDIAIWLATPSGRRAISCFDAMPDTIFAGYAARGVASRAAMIIDRAERDAAPLQCDGESFLSPGTIENWVALN